MKNRLSDFNNDILNAVIVCLGFCYSYYGLDDGLVAHSLVLTLCRFVFREILVEESNVQRVDSPVTVSTQQD